MKNTFGKIILFLFMGIFLTVGYFILFGKNNEHAINWLFILIPLLIFFGFIGSIIFVIIYFVKKNKNSKELANTQGWKYYKYLNDIEEDKPFLYYLKNSLFVLNKSDNYNLSDIINGKYNNVEFWFSFYNSYSMKRTTARNSSNFNIFVIPTNDINFTSELILFYKTRLMKLFMIEKLSNLIGKPLHSIEQQGYEWLLVTDADAFNNLNLNISDVNNLKTAMQDAHSIIIEKNFFIYAIDRNTTLSKEKIMEYLPKVQAVKNILTK